MNIQGSGLRLCMELLDQRRPCYKSVSRYLWYADLKVVYCLGDMYILHNNTCTCIIHVKCHVYMFLVFIPDQCIFFPFVSLLDQIFIIIFRRFPSFLLASDPAPDEVLEVLEWLCIQLLCI